MAEPISWSSKQASTEWKIPSPASFQGLSCQVQSCSWPIENSTICTSSSRPMQTVTMSLKRSWKCLGANAETTGFETWMLESTPSSRAKSWAFWSAHHSETNPSSDVTLWFQPSVGACKLKDWATRPRCKYSWVTLHRAWEKTAHHRKNLLQCVAFSPTVLLLFESWLLHPVAFASGFLSDLRTPVGFESHLLLAKCLLHPHRWVLYIWWLALRDLQLLLRLLQCIVCIGDSLSNRKFLLFEFLRVLGPSLNWIFEETQPCCMQCGTSFESLSHFFLSFPKGCHCWMHSTNFLFGFSVCQGLDHRLNFWWKSLWVLLKRCEQKLNLWIALRTRCCCFAGGRCIRLIQLCHPRSCTCFQRRWTWCWRGGCFPLASCWILPTFSTMSRWSPLPMRLLLACFWVCPNLLSYSRWGCIPVVLFCNRFPLQTTILAARCILPIVDFARGTAPTQVGLCRMFHCYNDLSMDLFQMS